jgi:N-acetylmuramoyl-L-alanine amidase
MPTLTAPSGPGLKGLDAKMSPVLGPRTGGVAISRSISVLLRLVLALPVPLFAAGSSEPIVVLRERDRLEVTPVVRGEVELVPLGALLGGLGVTQAPDQKGGLTLRFEGRQVTLYQDKSLASVSGDLRLLSSNVVVENGRWLVPIDSVARILGPLLKQRVEYRSNQRALLLGNVSLPRVNVGTAVSGDGVRVVLEASEKVAFRVQQEAGRVTVAVGRDVIDVPQAQAERLTGGIVDLVQFTGGRENVFTITLGRRFHTLQQQEQDTRLVLDFLPAPVGTASTAPGQATPPPPPAAVPSGAGPRTIIIDPGHGGAEVGAKGPGGTLEKDVTLAIARKVRAGLTNGLGLQAFLTRDRDQEVALDDRAALANNYKADLFISIHANASRSQGARGSEVYFLSYQAADDESRRIAALEGGLVTEVPGAATSSDLALILWDMAQAEHLEESSALASRVQEELASVTGSEARGVKQAPFRVLVGAAMPAILVEVAFISNAEEEKLLISDAYQSRIAAAVVKGVARYQGERAFRQGALRGEGRPIS